MLRMQGHETVVLDHSSAQLEMLRTFDVKVYFGDATRPDLLHAAGIEEAALLVICIDDKEQATQLVHHVVHSHPNVHIVARARDRQHVYDLYAAGCRDIIRETFDSGVRAGRSALEALGMHPYEAELFARDFNAYDRSTLAQMAQLYDPELPIHENEPYVEAVKVNIARMEEEIRGAGRVHAGRSDRGWTPPKIKDLEAEVSAAEKEARQ